MRRLLVLSIATLAFAALAQAPPPPKLEPLPEPPPPPPGVVDAPVEPQVTIRKRGEETVEEYRINGKLYMVKVTPAHGVPYVLIDHRGDGVMTRQEPHDTGLRVPQWVVKEF